MDASEELRNIVAGAEIVEVGDLPCPTGRIVACDPFFCASATPFAVHVDPGAYLVRLHRLTVPRWGSRIGAAELVLRPYTSISAFREARMENSSSSQYFVDSGLGSFMDEAARAEFASTLQRFYEDSPDGNYYQDVLASEFQATIDTVAEPLKAGDKNMHAYADAPHARVAMFSSGLGDGAYASLWGLDSRGELLSLFTSFLVLSRAGARQ